VKPLVGQVTPELVGHQDCLGRIDEQMQKGDRQHGERELAEADDAVTNTSPIWTAKPAPRLVSTIQRVCRT
jgi:hypothetical protein